MRADTTRQSRYWSAAPVIYYAPETGLAFGVGGIFYFRPSGQHRDSSSISNLGGLFLYSTRKQIRTLADVELFFREDDWRLEGQVGYTKFPDRFYGIGNDTELEDEEMYTSIYPWVRGTALRRVHGPLLLGASFLVEHNRFTGLADSGLLDLGLVPGVEGGWNWGIGPALVVDTRDNVYAPQRGWYLEARTRFHEPVLGSSQDYVDMELDLRHFADLPGSHVLALQAYTQLLFGDPPFHRMALLGGDEMLRGFFEGRYRERRYAAAQVEWRFPIWWFLRGAVFAAAGDVAHGFSDFRLREFKYAGGVGLRIVLDPEDRVTIRADFGIGRGGVTGFYFQFAEAF